MILRRMGNKSQIADKIQKYFPRHRLYAEPFFGAGGMYFNKPKARYNIMNDLDADVFNFWLMVSTRKDELEEEIKNMPVHSALLEYWKKNKETDPLRQALRFIFISNCTFMGAGASITFGTENPKQIIKDRLNQTFEAIKDVQFSNCDFRKFFDILRERNSDDTFIYCDPPYLGTDDNYSHSFTEQDSRDLFDLLTASGCKWAMSEFDNEFILKQANDRGLNTIIIGERGNLKNFRTEVLVTNYAKPATLFD